MAIGVGVLSCTRVGYLSQAARGQLELLDGSQPVATLVADPRAPNRLRQLLTRVSDVKAFGHTWGLQVSANFVRYKQLDRDAVVWVVTACEPLSFVARRWWFPLVGSVTTLGWFDRDAAVAFAQRLEEAGCDVLVRGAGAYATLGWFTDPVLSTMLTRTPSYVGDFVNVILHESVHATVYVPGQSYFNESLASFVSDYLTPIYLAQNFTKMSPTYRRYVAAHTRRQERQALYLQAAQVLEHLYASDASDGDKLNEKQAVLQALQAKLDLQQAPNNATLMHVRLYEAGRFHLAHLFEQIDRHWPTFLAMLQNITAEDFDEELTRDFRPAVHRALRRVRSSDSAPPAKEHELTPSQGPSMSAP